jgi:DMSO/TMAO reductase YedYZ molybdopterin-dependent catalytic subunit
MNSLQAKAVNKAENREYPFATLDSFITPAEDFYIRNHFPYPAVNGDDWRLGVEGEVEHPCRLTLAELHQLQAKTLTVTLECAGNHRSFLNPAVDGLQWGQGAVSNAEWRGVPLLTVLEKAGVKANALELTTPFCRIRCSPTR